MTIYQQLIECGLGVDGYILRDGHSQGNHCIENGASNGTLMTTIPMVKTLSEDFTLCAFDCDGGQRMKSLDGYIGELVLVGGFAYEILWFEVRSQETRGIA